MLARLGERVAAIFRATAPDPFVIAVLLTALTFVLVLLFTDAGPNAVVTYWSSDDGVWRFLGFAMQMCLILVTGHALASSPPVDRLLRAVAGAPRTGAQGAAVVAAVAATLGALNWGLGLIGGALLARRVGEQMSRRGAPAHYPLLAASGYVGLLVWHGGFSGTAPLKVTTDAELRDVLGDAADLIEPIPLTETLLSPLNLVATGGLLILAPLVMAMLSPRRAESIEPIERFVAPEESLAGAAPRPADERPPRIPNFLENSPLVSLLLAALIAWWAWGYYFPADLSRSGITRLTPNTVNLTMLMLGLILHGTPRRYVAAVDEAARGCAGIILQFPLYAGIMGMMHESGLTAQIARGLADAANQTTLPLFTFASAGLVNLFIPSGGGQWGVQGPVALQAALDAGVPPSRMVMAVAYGDQLTNMLQPFWALPLLAVTGVKARDIVGYTAILMVLAGAWLAACLLLF